MLRRTKSRLFLVGCVGILASGGCDLLAGDQLTAYVNPADPLLLSASTAAGEYLEVFGEKDSEGLATKMTSIRYQTADQVGTDAATWVFFDDESQISKFMSDDGTTIEYEWVSDTRVVIRVASADGSIQGSTAVDLDETETSVEVPVAPRVKPASRKNIPLRLSLRPRTPLDLMAPGAATGRGSLSRAKGRPAAQSSSQGQVFVTVKRCDAAVTNASVYVVAGNPFSKMLPTYPAWPTVTPGVYVANLPTVSAGLTGEQAQKICDTLRSVLGWGCKGVKAFKGQEAMVCASVAGLIDTVLGGPTGEAAPLFALCEAGFAAMNVYCKTINYKAVPGAPSLAGEICKLVKEYVDRAPADPSLGIIMYAEATAPGLGKGQSVQKEVSAAGPFSGLAIDYGSATPVVDPITISPADPAPGQSYVVTASVGCLSSSDLVRITVAGSDGYQGSAVGTIQSGETVLTLTVPGAAAGVGDLITLEINYMSMVRDAVLF